MQKTYETTYNKFRILGDIYFWQFALDVYKSSTNIDMVKARCSNFLESFESLIVYYMLIYLMLSVYLSKTQILNFSWA